MRSEIYDISAIEVISVLKTIQNKGRLIKTIVCPYFLYSLGLAPCEF